MPNEEKKQPDSRNVNRLLGIPFNPNMKLCMTAVGLLFAGVFARLALQSILIASILIFAGLLVLFIGVLEGIDPRDIAPEKKPEQAPDKDETPENRN